MKRVLTALLTILFFLSNSNISTAIYDPRETANNKYGIHILDESDIEGAYELVNSEGGEWGYVTFVIREDQRDVKIWQSFFDKLRRSKLIPIVRVAAEMNNGGWEKLNAEEIDNWIVFLNSLNWVVKNRYIVVGNEPNHKTEWGGEINPKEYSNYLIEFSQKAKEASEDFFILNAGFDSSAPNSKGFMDQLDFMKEMVEENPNIFEHIDGWTSHSYPNPGFFGSEKDTGRGTIQNYLWELETLKSMGFNKDYPVFITETGWPTPNSSKNQRSFSEREIGEKLAWAFQNVWNDNNIVAVTPFLLNYEGEPFESFSWRKKDGTFKDYYFIIQSLAKIKGSPFQINSLHIIYEIGFQKFIDEKTTGMALVRNTGQKIWEGESLIFKDSENSVRYLNLNLIKNIEPGELGLMLYQY
jgi:hypothetical protein